MQVVVVYTNIVIISTDLFLLTSKDDFEMFVNLGLVCNRHPRGEDCRSKNSKDKASKMN